MKRPRLPLGRQTAAVRLIRTMTPELEEKPAVKRMVEVMRKTFCDIKTRHDALEAQPVQS